MKTPELRQARSLLFVPAHRPERYAKAAASGTDVVCIDLEDAVPAEARPAARRALIDWLHGQPAGHGFGVRVSRLGSTDGLRDVLALHDAGVRPAFVMLAKTESAAEIMLLAQLLPGLPQIALLESARGLQTAAEVAAAAPAGAPLQALMFGGADMAADLGCDFSWEALLYARCTLVAAAATQGLASIDVPWLDLDDAEGCRAETARVAALGYTAKSLIHPAQVAPVHAGLAPTPQALAQAQRVVDACAHEAGAQRLDGRLVDRPVLLAAQRLLRRSQT